VLAGMTAFQFDPYVGNDVLVVKRSGVDGSERWRRTFTSSVVGIETARAVAVDRRGNVTAIGKLATENGYACLVTRLAGASGRTRWERRLHQTGWSCWDVALDRLGNFAVAGSALPPGGDLYGTSAAFVVARGTGWSGQGIRPVRVFP
jgi:hypothetical protein